MADSICLKKTRTTGIIYVVVYCHVGLVSGLFDQKLDIKKYLQGHLSFAAKTTHSLHYFFRFEKTARQEKLQ